MNHLRVVIPRHGGPNVLRVVEEPLPQPKPGQARIRVEAIGVAFADLLIRRGLYPGAPPLPLTPGYDCVGIVDALGSGVREPLPGTRVAALTVTRSYAQHVCVRARELVPLSPALDPAEAVCLVLNYVTAQQMLHRCARPSAGDAVLIHGAGGGVGTALLQLGKLAQLALYGTASAAKHEKLSGLGAQLIDHHHEDFVGRIRELTGGSGVRAAFDPIGGRNLWRSYRCLARGGTLLSYGVSAMTRKGGPARLLAAPGTFLSIGLLALVPDGKRLSFYSILSYKRLHPEWFREDLVHLSGLLERRAIVPIVAERIPLAQAARAHELLEQAAVVGKIVLIP